MKRFVNRYSVLVACSFIMLCAGLCYVWNIFQPVVIVYYNWSADKAMSVFSSIILFNAVGNMIGGRLSDKIGARSTLYLGTVLFVLGVYASSLIPQTMPWLLTVTLGFFMAVGSGLAYGAVVACSQKWWIERRGLATGVTTCAFGISTTLLAPLFNWMMRDSVLGYTATLKVMAAVFAVVMIGCSLFFREPDEAYMQNRLHFRPQMIGRKQYEPAEILRSPTYYMLLLSLMGLSAPYYMLNPAFKTLGLARSLTEDMAVFMIMCTGISSAAGRLIASKLLDSYGCKAVFYLMYGITLVFLLCSTFAHGLLFVVSIVLISLTFGSSAVISPVVATEYFGTKNMGTTVSMLLVAVLISGTCFPALSTLVSVDNLPSVWSFVMAAVIALIGLLTVIKLKKPEEIQMPIESVQPQSESSMRDSSPQSHERCV